MNYPWMIMPMVPFIPTNCDKPPTIYSLLNSYCNFGATEITKTVNLAKMGRGCIFDFEYTLSEHVSKEDFEVMILNHFIMRRIGFDTPTAFKIALSVKLNEILPAINKMFDMLDGWDVFNDGERVVRSVADNKLKNDSTITSVQSVTNGTDNGTLNQIVNNTSDRRYSNVPQNAIQDVRDGSYVTEYNYDTDNNINSQMTTNSSNTTNSANTNLSNATTESGTISEIIERTPSDKMKLYLDFMNNYNDIYNIIFKKLDPLFYGLD